MRHHQSQLTTPVNHSAQPDMTDWHAHFHWAAPLMGIPKQLLAPNLTHLACLTHDVSDGMRSAAGACATAHDARFPISHCASVRLIALAEPAAKLRVVFKQSLHPHIQEYSLCIKWSMQCLYACSSHWHAFRQSLHTCDGAPTWARTSC